jgi:pimeloyl-ACP methyl ester carboxylesterase
MEGTCRHLQFAARAKHDTVERFRALAAPPTFRSLVLGGDRDMVAPQNNVRELAKLLPGAECKFFDGGHGFLSSNSTTVPYLSNWVLGEVAGSG